jgi:hypothetical protein
MKEAQKKTTLESLQAEVDLLNKKCNALLELIIEQQANIVELVAALEEVTVTVPSGSTAFQTTKRSSTLK